MSKPKADLGSLVVTKAAAATAVPHAGPITPAPAVKNSPPASVTSAAPKALTVKLDADTYWRLQNYCVQRGQQEGRRITHQEAMVEGLVHLLNKTST